MEYKFIRKTKKLNTDSTICACDKYWWIQWSAENVIINTIKIRMI